MDSLELAKLIRNYRLDNNLTLKDVAEPLNVSVGYISRVEKGSSIPSKALLKSLFTVLHIPEHLLPKEPNDKNKPIDLKSDLLSTDVSYGEIKLTNTQCTNLTLLLSNIIESDWDNNATKAQLIANIICQLDAFKKKEDSLND